MSVKLNFKSWFKGTEENRTMFCCVITQRVLVIPYHRFGITYWSHLQGSRIQKESWEAKAKEITNHTGGMY